MRRVLALLSVISFSGGSLPAQQAELSGPLEGFIFDAPTGSFRAVIGLPGSAWLGPSILDGYRSGSVAPGKDYGLAFKDGKCAFVSGLGSARASAYALPGAIADAEGVVWSANGSLALLFSRTGNWIQTFAGIPDSAAPQLSVDLSVLGGSLSGIATDTTGRRIAIGVAGESGGVYLITDGGDPVPLLSGSKPVALAFSDDGSRLFALDTVAPRLTELQLSGLTSQVLSLEGLKDPLAIKATRDAANQPVLYVAGGNDRLLRAYAVSSHEILADIPLDFAPTELMELGRNTFVVATRNRSEDPLWLFTPTLREAFYFVPAGPADSRGAQ